VPTPVRVRVRVESPARIAVDGTPATLLPITARAVTIPDGPIHLAGRLLRPAGRTPVAGVVVVPGSEPARATTYDLWAYFLAAHGLAVLTYDKRGVGGSGGTYDRAADTANLRALAGDALAGVDWLRRRAGIRAVGLDGASQAGWVVEQAAARSRDVAFALLQSAPAMSVGRQLAYDRLTKDGWVDPGNDQTVQSELAAVPDSGYDPRADIGSLRIPVLWQLGSVDRRMFTPETVADLQEIGNPHVDVRVYPDGAHSLRQTADGLVRQEQTAAGYVPSVFADLAAWLRADGFGR
jgi:alpha/beta superfamily hydrolase